MARPPRLARWSEGPQYRAEPASGTVSAGYPYGFAPPFTEWNWLFWACGAWQVHLDQTALRGPDLWDAAAVYRVSATHLNFAVGGPLAQRPTVGAVYVVNAERVDASATGSDAPVYTFSANASNWVFLRLRTDSSRSTYPEIAVNTTGLSPGPGYARVLRVDTNATTVTAVVEPVDVMQDTIGWRVGHHAFLSTMSIVPPSGTNASALSIRSADPGIAPVVYVTHGNALANQTLFQGDSNPGGIVYAGSTSGAGGAVASFGVGNGARGAFIYCFGAGGAGLHIDAGVQNWAIALTPSSLEPAHDPGSPYASTVRVWGSSSFAPGLLWKNSSGVTYYPWASRQGPTRYDSGALPDTTIGAGVANQTVATSTQQTLVQGCTYLIMLDCGCSTSSVPNFTVAVTVLIDGVADTYWNARALTPPTLDTTSTKPWLQTAILYHHTAATTTTATVVIRVNHGPGAGNIIYRAPRIQILGGLP